LTLCAIKASNTATFPKLSTIGSIASNNINANLSAVDVKVVIDLGELKAYEYHTGVVFCAYNEDYSKALAQGGRYNGLSASFGRPRAATGFSFDLKFLTH
jgi:ATP phosphoribosyltransferase regulatory subunit